MPDLKQVHPLIGDVDKAAPESGANAHDRARRDLLSMSAEQQRDEVRRIIREAHAARTREMHAAFRSLFEWLWTTTMAASVVARHLAARLVAGLARLCQVYADRRRRRRATAELNALSDRDLKDIGVYRSGIGWALAHGRDDWHESPARIVHAAALPAPASGKPIANDPPSTARERRQRAA